MGILKRNENGIMICLFEIIVGILLLISPVSFTTIIIIIAGIVLLVAGIINIVKYFKTPALEAMMSQFLTRGLISLLIGGFCTFNSKWFITTFPVITIIYGIIILVTSINKIQLTIDLFRLKSRRWFLALISSIISLICAVVIINNPFASTVALWIFAGISLIIEGVLDAVTLAVNNIEK